jgi:hypothetical protein
MSFSFGFTLYVKGGDTLSGHGHGTINLGIDPYTSFAGTGSVTHGTGRYRHATGSGHFYGAENRLSHRGTIQVEAALRY